MAGGKRPVIALLTALEAEAECFISKTKNKTVDHWNGHEFTIGDFDGKECIIAHTGIGKVNAAIVTTYIIDHYNPGAVFFTGIAGALDNNLNIADVVIAMDCVQWDVDISLFGFKIGELPSVSSNPGNIKDNEAIRFYKSDPELLEKALTWNPGGFKVCTGRIITGDTFFSINKRNEMANSLSELNGIAVEMEGAAAAASAVMQNVPFFLARVISDTIDGRHPKAFKKFLNESSRKMCSLIEYILANQPC